MNTHSNVERVNLATMSTTKTIPYSQPQVQKTRTVSTKLNYEPLAPGEKREVFPMTASIFRRKYDTRDVEISDVRSPENGGEFDLNRHGFKYIKDPIDGRDMTDEAKIKADYYPALVEMLKKE